MPRDPLSEPGPLLAMLAVARAGSPNAAAREARVPATTYYRKIDHIEKAVGGPLFFRERGSWRPTAIGRRLLAIATDFERQMRDFRHAMSDEVDAKVLRVTTSDAFANFYLAGQLTQFAASHPSISVELIATNTRLDLSKGEADVAIRPHSQPGDGLVGRRAGHMLHAVFASESYLKSRTVPSGQQDVRSHDILGYGQHLAHFDAAAFTNALLQGRKAVAAFNDLTSMAHATEAGLGLAVLPIFVGAQIEQLRQLFLAENGLPADIWILCHATQRRNATVRAFVRHFAAAIGRDAKLFE